MAHDAAEAEIVARAGEPGTITLATNSRRGPLSGVDLHGDVGIAGRSLPEIDGLELPLFDGPASGEAAE